ncbi:MAG TPA: hypothetical protein VLR52_01255, partial [Bacteroidales bacterium]|nr:hypothetical protein [Bacteroidales bacterium]
WTYYLTTSGDNSNSFATRFGWGCRIPWLTRILPGSGKGDNNWEGSFFEDWPSNILLVSAEPARDGKSCIIHIRETDGKNASLNLVNGLTGSKFIPEEVDVTGKPVSHPTIEIGPLESKFYRIPLEINQ